MVLMDLDSLPRSKEEIHTAIVAARQAGPASIARLAMLCLWQVGQAHDPHKANPGPSSRPPLVTLQGVFIRLNQEAIAQPASSASFRAFSPQQPQAEPAGPTELLMRLPATISLEPPKYRASVQTGILHGLLVQTAFEDAWKTLPYIQESLLAIPPWSKLEQRTGDVIALLWPYLDEQAISIYPFVSGLLVSKANQSDGPETIWPMVHLISGMAEVIQRWSGQTEWRWFERCVRQWQGGTS
jgi:hypothetical protein